MAERSVAARLRVIFGVVATITLVYCLIGIALTGPVVVRTRPPGFEVAASPERLRETVEALAGEFAPRDWRHPQNLDRTARWIAGRLADAGLDVELQDYEVPEGRFRNVVGRRAGTDPTVGAIVLGAHYDALEGSPGANHDASGVAVLLELAQTRSQRTTRAARYFVAFSSHHAPFLGTEAMGSHHFAKRLADTGQKVDLMVALGSVGVYSSAPGSQRWPMAALRLYYPSRGDFVAVFGDPSSGDAILDVKQAMLATERIPVHSLRAPSWLAPVDASDAAAFRRLGLPGVLVTDTAALRDPLHHTPGDTPERLDYERMARLVEALAGVLWDPRSPDRSPA